VRDTPVHEDFTKYFNVVIFTLMFTMRRSLAAGHNFREACRSMASASSSTLLTAKTINAHIAAAQYAVRGEVVTRAMQINQELRAGAKRPYDKLVMCNIGNPQDLGQKPITFFRQVLSLVTYPDILDSPQVASLYPPDAIERARWYLSVLGGGTGAYSESQGVEAIRNEVARFISERDGYASHASNIFLTDGASPAVQMMLRALIRDGTDGIMTPIPQYPLYSAAIALDGGVQVGYNLVEDGGWRLDVRLRSQNAWLGRSQDSLAWLGLLLLCTIAGF
jgi:alanine transaminase